MSSSSLWQVVERAALRDAARQAEGVAHLLKRALSLVDVRVLDNLIVAGTNVLSFAEPGLI